MPAGSKLDAYAKHCQAPNNTSTTTKTPVQTPSQAFLQQQQQALLQQQRRQQQLQQQLLQRLQQQQLTPLQRLQIPRSAPAAHADKSKVAKPTNNNQTYMILF